MAGAGHRSNRYPEAFLSTEVTIRAIQNLSDHPEFVSMRYLVEAENTQVSKLAISQQVDRLVFLFESLAMNYTPVSE